MIRVMLVDDHEVVRTGLRAMLDASEGLEVVAEAASAGESVHRARAAQPDVVVMDVRLPDRSGVLACREIRSERPETAVLQQPSRGRSLRFHLVHLRVPLAAPQRGLLHRGSPGGRSRARATGPAAPGPTALA